MYKGVKKLLINKSLKMFSNDFLKEFCKSLIYNKLKEIFMLNKLRKKLIHFKKSLKIKKLIQSNKILKVLVYIKINDIWIKYKKSLSIGYRIEILKNQKRLMNHFKMFN